MFLGVGCFNGCSSLGWGYNGIWVNLRVGDLFLVDSSYLVLVNCFYVENEGLVLLELLNNGWIFIFLM